MLYRTTDYGQTWTPITAGLPDDDYTRVVREDPCPPGSALRRHRNRSLRVLQPGRFLATAARESARGSGVRPGGQGRQSGRGHPRAFLLDPGRPHPAAPTRAVPGRPVLRPAPTPGHLPGPLAFPGPEAQPRQDLPRRPGRGRHLQRIPRQIRRDGAQVLGRRREPARRGDDPLLPARGAGGRYSHHPGRQRRDRPELLQQSPGIRRRWRRTPPAGRTGHEPLRVEPALPVRPQGSRRQDHRGCGYRPPGVARRVPGDVAGERRYPGPGFPYRQGPSRRRHPGRPGRPVQVPDRDPRQGVGDPRRHQPAAPGPPAGGPVG